MVISHPESDHILILRYLREELKHLQDAQDKAMSNAVYGGLTVAEANELDMRRTLIHEVYEALMVLIPKPEAALLGALLTESRVGFPE